MGDEKKGWAIISPTCVIYGNLEQGGFSPYGRVTDGQARKSGKMNKAVFADRAACVAALDKKRLAKIKSLEKQIAALVSVTAESIVPQGEEQNNG
jgi:hypothetical protein